MSTNVKKKRRIEGSVQSYEESPSSQSKTETTKLRCFMGCSTTLFLLSMVFQLMTFGFVVVIWMNDKKD